MTFVFILTMYNAEPSAQIYIQATDLTGEDCIAAMVAYTEKDSYWTSGVPSCEINPASYPTE